jgi:ADP-ribose pyrophosphatase
VQKNQLNTTRITALPESVLESDPFQVVSSTIAYENPWIKVEHQEVVRPDGAAGIYGMVRFANRAVAILPIEANGDVWLVGQWRRPLNAWSWEIPEGGVPFDEDLEVGARRELEEEAGLIAGSFLKILEFDVSNCVCDEAATSFIAYDLTPGVLAPDPTEVLSLRKLHFTALLDEIDHGLIRDGLTLATVLRAHQLAISNRLPARLSQAMLKPPTGE